MNDDYELPQNPLSLHTLAERTGIPYSTIKVRKHRGDTGADLTRPLGTYSQKSIAKQSTKASALHINLAGIGIVSSFVELAKITGLSRSVLKTRHHRGDRGARLVRPVADPPIQLASGDKTISITFPWLAKLTQVPEDVLRNRYAAGDRNKALIRHWEPEYLKPGEY